MLIKRGNRLVSRTHNGASRLVARTDISPKSPLLGLWTVDEDEHVYIYINETDARELQK